MSIYRIFHRLGNCLLGRGSTPSPTPPCTLSEGARLHPEAAINNLSRKPDRIRIGCNSHVRGRLLIYSHGGEIAIGDWSYVGVRSEIWSMNSISIGNRVLISHDVNIHDGTAHSMDPTERHEHFKHIIEKGHPQNEADLPGVHSDKVRIEDDVWINFGVTILRGVTIGKRSVIAAGSIVSKDVPPDSLYRNALTPIIIPLDNPKGL